MKVFLLALLLVSFFQIPHSYAGNGGRGGIPETMEVDAFTKYIVGDGLKLSVSNYLKTLRLDQISDPVNTHVKTTFEQLLQGGIQEDVIKSEYLVGLENCKDPNDTNNPDSWNPDVRAWTNTGKNGIPNLGGKICFDVVNLVADYKKEGRSIEDSAIRLVALAIHEHVHHYQNESSDSQIVQSQENEAKATGGYVLLNYKQVLLFEWSDGVKLDTGKKLISCNVSELSKECIQIRGDIVRVGECHARQSSSYRDFNHDGLSLPTPVGWLPVWPGRKKSIFYWDYNVIVKNHFGETTSINFWEYESDENGGKLNQKISLKNCSDSRQRFAEMVVTH
jgi:hypothetical protein